MTISNEQPLQSSHEHCDSGSCVGESVLVNQRMFSGSEIPLGQGAETTLERTVTSLDNLGMIASIACLIHCLAMPFVLAALPFLGLQWLSSHESHLYLAVFIWLFALFAIVPGYLRHKNKLILAGTAIGLGLVTFGALGAHCTVGEELELPIMITGNLLLVTVHWKNRSMFKCCSH